MNIIPDDLAARLRHSLDSRGAAPELSPELVSNAQTRTPPRMANRARQMQLAGGVTLAVAAVAVVSLVVASPLQQAPLFTSAVGASTSGFGAPDDAAISSMPSFPWVNYEYVPGSGLSSDRGSGSVFQLQRTGTAVDSLRDVARAFNLDGEPTKSEYFDANYPTYVIGAEDGSAPSLVLNGTGTGSWWFNDPTAYPPFECVVVEHDITNPEADDEFIDPICSAQEPVVADSLAPGEPEARQQAFALFTATGLDVAASDIRINVDAWQTTANANLTVDGIATAIDWTVSWSAATGKVAWATGHSISIVDRGEFGTISAADAVRRLSDWRWFGSAGPEYQGGMHMFAVDGALEAEPEIGGGEAEGSPAPDAPATPGAPGEPGEPGESPTEPSEPGEPSEPAEPSEPVEPMPLPEPETVVVTVDIAEATLLLMWDSEGNAWLVPGFAMQHAEGWWNAVVSLDEGVIALPEPIEVEPSSDSGRLD